MKFIKRVFLSSFAAVLVMSGLAYDSFAQSGGYTGDKRPVIVRTYVYHDPFWRPYNYDPYYYNPYYRAERQRAYLYDDLEGNLRELAEHRREYTRDGVITAKERRELADDVRDVRRSRARLRGYPYVY